MDEEFFGKLTEISKQKYQLEDISRQISLLESSKSSHNVETGNIEIQMEELIVALNDLNTRLTFEIREISNKIVESNNNDEIVNQIHQALNKQEVLDEKSDDKELLKNIRDELSNAIQFIGGGSGTDKTDKLMEHVHLEAVKVYRNVQAIVKQGFEEQADNLSNSEAKITKNIKGMKGILITILIFLIINLLMNGFSFGSEIMEMLFR